MVAPGHSLDCRRCGACCVNTPENRAAGYVDYVEVEPDDRILTRGDLRRRYTVERDGAVHLRLAPDGRCLALGGRLGGRVRCAIYAQRPSPCRRVQPGSELCLGYRSAHGLGC
jgi:Fe-S-cluster containining protein